LIRPTPVSPCLIRHICPGCKRDFIGARLYLRNDQGPDIFGDGLSPPSSKILPSDCPIAAAIVLEGLDKVDRDGVHPGSRYMFKLKGNAKGDEVPSDPGHMEPLITQDENIPYQNATRAGHGDLRGPGICICRQTRCGISFLETLVETDRVTIDLIDYDGFVVFTDKDVPAILVVKALASTRSICVSPLSADVER